MSTAAGADADLLTTREVATRARVSTVTVTRWAKDGTLPAIRVSERVLRFRRGDVDKLLAPAEPCPHPSCTNERRTTFHFSDPCPYADEPESAA